jgi:hypothetical protein
MARVHDLDFMPACICIGMCRVKRCMCPAGQTAESAMDEMITVLGNAAHGCDERICGFAYAAVAAWIQYMHVVTSRLK